MQKSPDARMSRMSSSAWAYCPGWGKPPSLGRSPRSASTFSIPRSLSSLRTVRTPSFVEETHVRCASAGTPQRSTSPATSAVKAEVPPPAPYVTEMNVGCSAATWRAISLYSESSLPSLGGNSSQESVTSCSFRHCRIFISQVPSFRKAFPHYTPGRAAVQRFVRGFFGRRPSLSNSVEGRRNEKPFCEL